VSDYEFAISEGTTIMVTSSTHRKAISARRVALLGVIAAAVVVASYVATITAPAQYSARAQASDACATTEVVFARGTGEPDGVGAVGQAFVNDLRNSLKGQNIHVYAVNYPASYDFMKAVDGAHDAAAHIQSVVAACPTTNIVLGGFSQGAAVVDLITADPAQAYGFAVPMTSDVADHVAAVAVFGNPSQKIGKSLVANSPLYGAKTIELCNGADPVCSPGSDRAAHSLYPQAGLTSQAAAFVAQRLSHPADSAVMQQAAGVVPPSGTN
jgi:cutinase